MKSRVDRVIGCCAAVFVAVGCVPDGTGGTTGGAGGDAGTIGVGGVSGHGGTLTIDTAAPCALEYCPPPVNDECGRAECVEGACSLFLYPEDALCGFAGHCDGEGNCEGLVKPLECDSPCVDAGECSEGYCDPYTGTCEQHTHGNGTLCDGGAGHCNSSTGTCCHGYQYAKCEEIADPSACFEACLADTSACVYACATWCPLGTIAVPEQGICVPA